MDIDISLVDWSRAQFALTALYHWIFVPLTLGLSFIIALMESMYVYTGNEEWKKVTKFWMNLFAINFAIGVATGIILEFEFGTNWSNYSWLVGDIFGAPLAVEGIMAFFLESTFIAVMFFGWNKVSKKFHLLSTWLVAIGSNLSALWILVANGWMQSPVGMQFNPDTARSEMVNFWDVLLSPVAVNKFLHTISSSYIVGAAFVVGISAFYLLRKKHIAFSKKSIFIAAVFGLMASLFTGMTGDGSAYQVAQTQPMKLAAMEGHYVGQKGAGLVLFGILNDKKTGDTDDHFAMKVELPKVLSYLSFRDADAFVPGINDIVYGNQEENIEGAQSKMMHGKEAIEALRKYKSAKKSDNIDEAEGNLAILKSNFKDIGYGYLNEPEEVVPNVPLTFYSFHTMVGIGFLLILVFAILAYLIIANKLENKKLILKVALLSIPLAYIASMLGWIVAEVGRQPWAIQDLLPVSRATSALTSGTVELTFWMFLVLFTGLLIAEVSIMIKQIKIGPKGDL